MIMPFAINFDKMGSDIPVELRNTIPAESWRAMYAALSQASSFGFTIGGCAGAICILIFGPLGIICCW